MEAIGAWMSKRKRSAVRPLHRASWRTAVKPHIHWKCRGIGDMMFAKAVKLTPRELSGSENGSP
jgi:hypothetical protein